MNAHRSWQAGLTGLALGLLGCSGQVVDEPVTPSPSTSASSEIAREGPVRWQAGAQRRPGALSTSGRYLARGVGPDGGEGSITVEVLDVETGDVRMTLAPPAGFDRFNGSVSPVFAPGDERLAITWKGSDKLEQLVIYDTTSGELTRTFELDLERSASDVGFSPDGTALYLSSNWADSVSIFDLESGATTQVEVGDASRFALGPRGQTLAAARGGMDEGSYPISILEVASGRVLVEWSLAGFGASSLVFSPTGERLAATGGLSCMVHVWDAATGELVFEHTPLDYELNHVDFAPDGTLWSKASDFDRGNAVQILGWDAQGQEIARLRPSGVMGYISANLQLGFDGQEVTAYDGRLTPASWDRRSGELKSHPAGADVLRFSADSRLLYGIDRQARTVLVWDAETGEAQGMEVPAYEDTFAWEVPELDLDHLPGWRVVAAEARERELNDDHILPIAGGESFILIDDSNLGLEQGVTTVEFFGALESSPRFDVWERSVYDASVSADGKWLMVSQDAIVSFFDASNGGELVRELDLAVNRSRWSPTNELIALWDDTARSLYLVEPLRGPRPDAEMGPELETNVEDMGVQIAPDTTVLEAAFSPDGAYLALALLDGLELVEVSSGVTIPLTEMPFVDENWGVEALAFSPDGRSLAATNSEGFLVVWDLQWVLAHADERRG